MSSSSHRKSAEQRGTPRTRVEAPCDVRDANSGLTIGQLVNISAQGLMLLSPFCIAPGTIRRLHIPVAGERGVTTLELSAENLWSQDANDSGAYWAGFQIIDISPDQQALLERFLRR